MGLRAEETQKETLPTVHGLGHPNSFQDELLSIAHLTQADWSAQQRRVPQQEIRAVLQDFGEEADKARVVLNALAVAGSYASLNGVLNYYQVLQEQHGQVAILDICPTSIGASISYLFNRSFFKDHPSVAHNFEQEVSGQGEARIKSSMLVSYEHFKSWAGSNTDKSPKKAVLFLDQATYNYLDTQPEMVETLRGILSDPNVKLVSPIGFDQGISALNWNPATAQRKIQTILRAVRAEVTSDQYDKMTTEELQERVDSYFQKSDQWPSWLRKRYGDPKAETSLPESSPLRRFYQLKPDYIAPDRISPRPDDISIESTQHIINMEQPNSTVGDLLQIFKAVRSESPDKLSYLVSILREHTRVYTWFRLANIARSMHTEIKLHVEKQGKEPIFVVPAKSKSFALATETYRTANQLPTKNFWDFDRLKKAIAQDPDFAKRYSVVVVDDLSASGESSEKVIRKIRRLADLHNADRKHLITSGSYPELTQGEIKFDGEVIIAPFSGSTFARRYLMDRDYGKVEFFAGDLIKPYYELNLFTQASMGERLAIQKMLRDGSGSLGYRELGLMTVFPWGSPNNIPEVFARFTPLFASANSSKLAYTETNHG